jgi:hypothetical protein
MAILTRARDDSRNLRRHLRIDLNRFGFINSGIGFRRPEELHGNERKPEYNYKPSQNLFHGSFLVIGQKPDKRDF